MDSSRPNCTCRHGAPSGASSLEPGGESSTFPICTIYQQPLGGYTCCPRLCAWEDSTNPVLLSRSQTWQRKILSCGCRLLSYSLGSYSLPVWVAIRYLCRTQLNYFSIETCLNSRVNSPASPSSCGVSPRHLVYLGHSSDYGSSMAVQPDDSSGMKFRHHPASGPGQLLQSTPSLFVVLFQCQSYFLSIPSLRRQCVSRECCAHEIFACVDHSIDSRMISRSHAC